MWNKIGAMLDFYSGSFYEKYWGQIFHTDTIMKRKLILGRKKLIVLLKNIDIFEDSIWWKEI